MEWKSYLKQQVKARRKKNQKGAKHLSMMRLHLKARTWIFYLSIYLSYVAAWCLALCIRGVLVCAPVRVVCEGLRYLSTTHTVGG